MYKPRIADRLLARKLAQMIYKMQFKRYILIHLSVTYQLPYARLSRLVSPATILLFIVLADALS